MIIVLSCEAFTVSKVDFDGVDLRVFLMRGFLLQTIDSEVFFDIFVAQVVGVGVEATHDVDGGFPLQADFAAPFADVYLRSARLQEKVLVFFERLQDL